MATKRVLVITYYWPPAAGPGVQRFLKFCKYLRDFDWEPIVLTVENGSYSSTDNSLEKDIPTGTKVYKTKTFEPFQVYNSLRGQKGKGIPVSLMGIKEDKRFIQKLSILIRANFFVPDARKGWRPFAVKKAKKLINQYSINAIVTTGPPQSTHLIGRELKKEFGIPWIADFRDPWTTVFYNKFFPRTKKAQKKDKKLEDAVLSECDAITVVSNGLAKEFEDRASKIEVIYNGFDEADIPDKKQINTDTFSLEYIGNLKPNQNVEALYEAISELKNENAAFSEDFKLNFTGNVDAYLLEEMCVSYGLKSIVKVLPYVPHQEAVNRMVKSNILLFIIPRAENNRLIITGKLFEYMASATPMLSIGPIDGDASLLIKEGKRGTMLDYADKDGIKALLIQRYLLWKEQNGKKTFHVEDGLKQFSRRELTRKLSNVLNSAIGDE